MSKIILSRGLSALIILASFSTGKSQTPTHLPYSIFGIGELSNRGYGRNLGMGKSGIGLASGRFLNNLNPASYHALDSISFFFDFGFNADFVRYRTEIADQRGTNINLRNLSMAFRNTSFWASGIGVMPFSEVGYKVISNQPVEGNSDEYEAELSGKGGLNKFYWDNTFTFFKHLSVGISFNYLFGNIISNEQVQYDRITTVISRTQNAFLSKAFFDFGLQYHRGLPGESSLVVGGVFGNNHRLKFREELSVSTTGGSIIEDEVNDRGTFDFPLYAGGGLSYSHAGKLVVSADYLFQNWSATKTNHPYFRYRNTNAYHLGLEFLPGNLNRLGFWGSVHYRAGVFYEESYLEVEETRLVDKGLTVGFGIPLVRNRTSINLAYLYGNKGTLEGGLVKLNYHSIALSMSLHDWWFIKPKYD